MYKIVKLTEDELESFKGKIITVIDSQEKEKIRGYVGSIGTNPIYEKYFQLTCLVEVKECTKKK